MSANNNFISHFKIKKLLDDPDSKIQVEILNILAKTSFEIPIETLLNKINHSNIIIVIGGDGFMLQTLKKNKIQS